MPSKAIESDLSDTRIFIDNVLADPDILAAFDGVGRGAAFFEEGRALYQRAFDLYLAKEHEYADKEGATGALRQAVTEADAVLQRHLEWARFVDENGTRLNGRINLDPLTTQPLDEWLTRATDFYEVVLSDAEAVAALAAYNIARDELERGQYAVSAIFDLRSTQARERGEATASTTARNDAVAAVRAWLREQQKLARLLFADAPAHLDELGIRPRRRSRKPRATTEETSPPPTAPSDGAAPSPEA